MDENDASDKPEARRRKAYMVARHLGLDRDDRLALAEKLLHHDCESWRDLTDLQISRLLDAMEGHELICFLKVGITPIIL